MMSVHRDAAPHDVERHLETCASCIEELEALRDIVARLDDAGAGRLDRMEPAATGRAALALYRQEVEDWRRIVNLDALPDPVSVSLKADLALYDEAVADVLTLLDENPGDVEWTGYLIHLLQAQTRLLVRAQETAEILS
jgi:hypothetical protein